MAVMKKNQPVVWVKRMCALCVAVMVCGGLEKVAHAQPPAPQVVATSAVVMDAKTGLVVFEKDKDQKNFPASITKVMTALLAIEYATQNDTVMLNESIPFSYDAVFTNNEIGGSHIAMDEGETLSIKDALYAVLLASANEVSNALAEYVGGSNEKFAQLMTQRAQALGAKNTNFVNPHGLHDAQHVTTAYDMALIMKEAITHPEFVKTIATEHYDIAPTERQPEERPLNNSHKMILPTSAYYNASVVGGKTGFTSQSRHTLVTYAKQGDVALIVVVMNDEKAAAYTDTQALLDDGFGQYVETTLFDHVQFKRQVPAVEQTDGTEKKVDVVQIKAESSVKMNLPKSLINQITVTDNLPKSFTRSVKAGEEVGVLAVNCGNETIAEVVLTAFNAVELAQTMPAFAQQSDEGGFSAFIWQKVKQVLTLSGVILFALFAVVMVIRTKKRLRRSARYKLSRSKQTTYRYR